MRRPNRVLCVALGCALLVVSGCAKEAEGSSRPAPIRVAAASDLSLALPELSRSFELESGRQVILSFGSTGMLVSQLREGAPFDLFAAASKRYVDEIVATSVCDEQTRAAYGRGRLALLASPETARLGRLPHSLQDLAAPWFKRIAIAQPEHAPYGKAAREALISLDLWQRLAPRVVYAESVRQTVQLAETDNVEAAVTALSLVIDRPKHTWLALDEGGYAPIEQELVVCNGGRAVEGGRAFAAFLRTARARQVMNRYGFILPGESLRSAP